MSFLVVYITHPSENNAQMIAEKLLEERLIACANIFPIKSAFWWQNNISQEEEWVSIVKTIPTAWELLQCQVDALHPYEVPCIMKFEVSANKAYEEWIYKEVVL